MADTEFKEKLRSLSFSTGAKCSKKTVDVYDSHTVTVTESGSDRVDVKVKQIKTVQGPPGGPDG